MANTTEFLQRKADEIRIHSIKMTTEAGSGHPTSSMSEAELLSVLYFDQMKVDPGNMDAPGNDEFVISKGHGVPGLYGAFEEAGMVDDQAVMKMRSFDSPLEGHPVPRVPGIKVATGSLGQGLSVGLGMAMAMKMDKVSRSVYVLLGDGEMAEGNVWEAINLAPHLGLDNIVGILDMNRLGQSDPTMYQRDAEAYARRISGFDWKTIIVNGHDIEELRRAFEEARSESRPTFIIARTVKGKGASFAEDKDGLHGKPFSADDARKAIEEIKSHEPQSSEQPQNFISLRGNGSHKKSTRPAYSVKTEYNKGDKVATRDAYGNALRKLGEQDEEIVVLDGDVKNSTRLREFFKAFPDRAIETYIGEQNMIGMALGLQARGKRAHAATFSAFLTRAHDQIRMASHSQAEMHLAGSHTGVSIGQDGPSQMGLEDIAMMRAVFDSVVVSPSDAVSAEKLTAAAAAYRGVTYVRTMRGKTPVLYDNDAEFEIGGSAVLRSSDQDVGAIVATGITVSEALKAADTLEKEGTPVTVVDCYSLKPVDAASLQKVADRSKFILTAEDHYPEGGLGDAVCSAISFSGRMERAAVTRRPHSGSPDRLLAEQKLDAEGLASRVRELAK
ncbi:transketolase [Salinispira pacifica]